MILGGAVAAPAVGVRYIAETLWHPAIGGEITSNSEWIDTSASDAAAFIRQANPRWIPLPPGLTWEQETVAVTKSFTDNPGLTQCWRVPLLPHRLTNADDGAGGISPGEFLDGLVHAGRLPRDRRGHQHFPTP
jgi:hypothetical protein